MPIFQKSVLKKHLRDLDDVSVEKAYQTFLANYTPSKIEKIKTLKEEEYQDGFLRDLTILLENLKTKRIAKKRMVQF